MLIRGHLANSASSTRPSSECVRSGGGGERRRCVGRRRGTPRPCCAALLGQSLQQVIQSSGTWERAAVGRTRLFVRGSARIRSWSESRAMVKVPTTSRFAVFHEGGSYQFHLVASMRESPCRVCSQSSLKYYPLPGQWSGGDWGEKWPGRLVAFAVDTDG